MLMGEEAFKDHKVVHLEDKAKQGVSSPQSQHTVGTGTVPARPQGWALVQLS